MVWLFSSSPITTLPFVPIPPPLTEVFPEIISLAASFAISFAFCVVSTFKAYVSLLLLIFFIGSPWFAGSNRETDGSGFPNTPNSKTFPSS